MLSTVFLFCAIGGGILFVIQMLLSLVGLDADVDADVDLGDSTAFFGVLSVRAIVAAITFFGLGGKIALTSGLGEAESIGVAVGIGLAALLVVALMMRALHGLRAEGNVRIKNAVGLPAKVYLRIPPDRAGTGRVQMTLQGRTVEFLAMTAEPEELPTGMNVVVVRAVNAETVEVERQD